MARYVVGLAMWVLLIYAAPAALAAGQGETMSPATPPVSDQSIRPSSLAATIGDIRFHIDGPKLWTLSGIKYQNVVMAVEDSAYGTVITLDGIEHGHLGTAHFLDVPGKPGEVEKENVLDIRIFIDDKPIELMPGVMEVSGESFRMERKSKIRALDLESTVDVRDGVLIETSSWYATKSIDLKMTYPLMYAWTPKATNYVFGDDNGIQKRGVFKKDGETASNEGLEKMSRWMAVFNRASGKGSVCYLVKHPPDADGWLQWTDAPGVYRKLRIMSFVEKIVPEGFEGTYQSAVGFFSANESDWEQHALKRVAELKSVAETREKP